MKKFLFTVVAVVLLFVAAVSVHAGDGITVKVNGNVIDFDVDPVVTDGTTIVPVRAISEALGFQVHWDEAAKQVDISKGGNRIVLTIDSTSALVNGKEQKLLKPACILGGRTMIPLRFVSEHLDCTVDWFKTNNIAAINAKAGGRAIRFTDRMVQSEEYTVSKIGLRNQYTRLTPINENLHYTITDSVPEGSYDGFRQTLDAEIGTTAPDIATRNAVKEVLRLAFPKEFETIYMYYVVCLRGEAFEFIGAGLQARVGINNAYHEGRDVIVSSGNINNTSIAIGMEGPHLNIGGKMFKTFYPTTNLEFRQMVVEEHNVTEYTIDDYNKIRRDQYMKEFLQWYEKDMTPGLELDHYVEREDVDAQKDYNDALSHYPVVAK